MKKIFLLCVLFTALGQGKETEENPSPEVVGETQIIMELGRLEKTRNNLQSIISVIQMIRLDSRDPFNGEGINSIEEVIPAIKFLENYYDEDVLPQILSYALNVENDFLKRRAVYCIENISGLRVDGYLEKELGQNIESEKIETLIESSFHEERRQMTVIRKMLSDDLREGKLDQEEKEALSVGLNKLISKERHFFFPVAGGKYDDLLIEK